MVHSMQAIYVSILQVFNSYITTTHGLVNLDDIFHRHSAIDHVRKCKQIPIDINQPIPAYFFMQFRYRDRMNLLQWVLSYTSLWTKFWKRVTLGLGLSAVSIWGPPCLPVSRSLCTIMSSRESTDRGEEQGEYLSCTKNTISLAYYG